MIAGAVPHCFLVAIRALLDFHYLAQAPVFSDQSLDKLMDALWLFHVNKDAIVQAGCRSSWQIPKLELLQSVVSNIRRSGPIMQWSADAIEHAWHVQEIKNPAQMGNNQNYYDQITCHLDRSDKCSCFDLATCLETWEMGMGAASSYNDSDDFDEDEEDEVDDANSLIQQLYPSRSAVNYFSIADSLACSCTPNVPTPSHTFATTTTTFHIATKPSLHLSVDEAATQFGILDLHPTIKDFLQWEQDNSSHPVKGVQMQDSQCPLPFDRVQI